MVGIVSSQLRPMATVALVLRSPTRLLGLSIAAVAAFGLGMMLAVESLIGLGGSGDAVGAPGSARPAVPALWRLAEQAATCPEAPAELLGALGWLASRSGRVPGDRPPPWSSVPRGPFGVDAPGARPPSRLSSAARRAGRQLCGSVRSLGIAGGLTRLLGSTSAALEVEVIASSLMDLPEMSEARATAVDFAVHALGVPYQWGGNGPATYDCSGLTVAAMRAAGSSAPRTAQSQFDASVRRSLGQPGDLVFFGSSPSDVGHVGLVIGGGRMIDAPHAGAVVRIEADDWPERVGFGSLLDG